MSQTNAMSIANFTAALKKYRSVVRRGRRLDGDSVYSVTVYSRGLCGSKLTLDAKIVDGVLQEVGFNVSACSMGQATLAMVYEHAQGLTKQDVLKLLAQLEVLLQGRMPDEALIWPEMAILEEGASLVNRHDSPRLVFRALLQLFEKEEANVLSLKNN